MERNHQEMKVIYSFYLTFVPDTPGSIGSVRCHSAYSLAVGRNLSPKKRHSSGIVLLALAVAKIKLRERVRKPLDPSVKN